MKVWIVNQYAIPPSRAGITRHYSLARELAARGHEVALIASSFDHVQRQETRTWGDERHQTEIIDGVRFVWLKSPPYSGNSPARAWNMLAFAAAVVAGRFDRALGRPDVVIGSSPSLFTALAASRLARRLRVPFVLEVRDLWPQSLVDLANVPEGHPLVKLLAMIERHLYDRAAHVLTPLPAASGYLGARGVSPERLTWLPNGVDVRTFPPPNARATGSALTFTYAGSHGLANGLDALLDAAKLLQAEGLGGRITLRLVGDGPEKSRLQRRAAEEGLDNVVFEPALPKHRVPECLQTADAFVFLLRPSPVFRWGISPNKLFDYMAAGRPVVAAVSAPLNPIEAADAGLTVAPEAAAIAQAIRRIAAMDPAERWAMGQRGRRFVEDHHDFRAIARRLERVLLEVVRGRAKATA